MEKGPRIRPDAQLAVRACSYVKPEQCEKFDC